MKGWKNSNPRSLFSCAEAPAPWLLAFHSRWGMSQLCRDWRGRTAQAPLPLAELLQWLSGGRGWGTQMVGSGTSFLLMLLLEVSTARSSSPSAKEPNKTWAVSRHTKSLRLCFREPQCVRQETSQNCHTSGSR